jgi:CysZ protein
MGAQVILGSFGKAVAQLSDRRFRRVVFLGVALTLALLIGVYAGFLALIQIFVPDMVEIPFVGPVGGLGTLLSVGSAILMIGLSVFLMIPVASAFSGLFLEDVAHAVEARHYPALPPVAPVKWSDNLIDAFNFFALLCAVNVVALVAYAVAGPIAPLLFWSLNGFLLGREYFTLVAMRRVGRAEAKRLRSQHLGTIFMAGVMMAAPLSVPLVNLIIPVLGVATFTHIFHRLNGTRPAGAA